MVLTMRYCCVNLKVSISILLDFSISLSENGIEACSQLYLATLSPHWLCLDCTSLEQKYSKWLILLKIRFSAIINSGEYKHVHYIQITYHSAIPRTFKSTTIPAHTSAFRIVYCSQSPLDWCEFHNLISMTVVLITMQKVNFCYYSLIARYVHYAPIGRECKQASQKDRLL